MNNTNDKEPITKNLRSRTIKSQSNTKKQLSRSKRATIVDANAIQYPPLNLTITSSPRSIKKREKTSKMTPNEDLISHSQTQSTSSSSRKHSSLTTTKNIKQATRKLNFTNLTTTILEEKIECKYKAQTPTKNANLKAIALSLLELSNETKDLKSKTKESQIQTKIAQLEQEDLFNSLTTDSGNFCNKSNKNLINEETSNSKDEIPKERCDNIMEAIQITETTKDIEEVKLSQKTQNEEDDILLCQHTPIEISQKFIDKLYKQVSQDEISNHSEDLFSPQSLTPVECNENEEIPQEFAESSPEELIAPYQVNQTDTCLESLNTKISEAKSEPSTDNMLNSNEENKTSPNLTKAEEYDLKNNIYQQPGPSYFNESIKPTNIELENKTLSEQNKISEVVEQNKDANADTKSLISYLEVTNLSGVDTLSLNTTTGIMKYIIPKFKPPSKALIQETMSSYNIPNQRNQDPFYSEITHVTGPVDIGHYTLRILGKHQHEEFNSSFPTLLQFQRETSEAKNLKELNTLKLSYFNGQSCFIQPVRKPPTVKEVKLWLVKQKHKAKVKRLIEDENPDFHSGKSCKEVQDCDTTEMLGLTMNSSNIEENLGSPTLNKSSWENTHAISGVSLNNTHGFKMTLENLQEARSLDIYQYITSLVMELHIETRGSLHPDPQIDPIQVIFFALANDVPDIDKSSGKLLNLNLSKQSNNLNLSETIISEESDLNKMSEEMLEDKTLTTPISNLNSESLPSIDPNEKFLKGFICVSPNYPNKNLLAGTGITNTKYTFVVPDEQSLFKKFLELFHLWNPDILMGYEIEQSSWGYLVDRGYVLGMNLPSLISRIKDEKKTSHLQDDPQEELHSHLKVTGRIVLDLWRILKHEIALQSYTFENLAYHVLHERLPHYSFKDLTMWWNNTNPKYRHRTINYYLHRVEGAFRLIDHYDLIGRTSELARLFGITFYEVLSRGSQFRVESMMLRLAKPYKYIPVSPSVQQRAHMKAPEFLPLILEPESKFYKDPVIVLDFQSLYPSIIIAYNYCFSTCLGRVEHLASDAPFEFGAYELEVSRKLVAKFLAKNMLTISPCGVAFVKEEIRPGILPRMLREILDTRLMVKKSMKKHKANKTLQKVLHSRQLGLKLIANVTYGYTAANYSGRMPSCEIADSVLSKGRETLQRAIALVEKHPSWGARVVYGDTDSMFVLCPGKTREEAFKIGEEIADAVTNANPSPIKLKLEKVYQPCILQTKKRYVGYMYESKDQKDPEFEAKGIETVRRDGCPATSKMLEKCLRLLFEKRDVSEVRNYVVKQFHKILTGRVSIQDLTFAKEYRGKEGYRPGACVPALELTRKWLQQDKRKEPRSGERVPYVIVHGPPGLSLIKLVRSPHELLEDPNLRPNALYYITKAIIPPINRCFKLIGADLFHWFNEMPRKQKQYLHTGSPKKGPKSTISQYFATAACASCGVQTRDGLCPLCLQKPQKTISILLKKTSMWERNYFNCKKICESCCGRSTDLNCNSLDCPVLYRRKQTSHDLQQTEFVRSLLDKFPEPSNNIQEFF